MTVSSTITPKKQYAGSGTTGPFTVTFPFRTEDELLLIKTDSGGTDTTLTLTTHYTVSGGGTPPATGSVTLVSALAVGEVLTIIRNTPVTQDSDYVDGNSLPAETLEANFDKLTLIVQELQYDTNRAVQLPQTSSLEEAYDFPNPLANGVIRFNSAADGLEAVIYPDVTAGSGLSYNSGTGAFDVNVGTGLTISTDTLVLNANLGDLLNVVTTTPAKGHVLVHNGTNWVNIAPGTNGYVLSANSAATNGIEWVASSATVDLTTDVTGILPIANGGTNASTATAAFDNLAPGTTKGDIVVFDGTNHIRVGVGTDGQILKADSAEASGVVWATAAAGVTDINDLGDVNITAAAKGDILVFNGTNWVDLTVGSNDQVLVADSTQATGVKWAASSVALNDVTDVTITGATKGDILVYNGTAWVDLSVGTNDQVLTADSAQATGVKWAAAAGGGGGLVHLATYSPSAVSSLDITSVIDTTYDEYVIILRDILTSVDTTVDVRFSDDNGSTFETGSSSYFWSASFHYPANPPTNESSDGASFIRLHATGPNTSTDYLGGTLRLYVNGLSEAFLTGDLMTMQSTNMRKYDIGGGVRSSVGMGAINAIQIRVVTGTFSGSVRVYGIAKS